MSTAMLRSLLDESLDPAYAAAARRRATRAAAGVVETRGAVRRGWILAVAGIVLAGLMLGSAYETTRRSAPQSEHAREQLVEDVRTQQDVTDTLQSALEKLQVTVSDERDAVLAASGQGAEALQELQALETAVGGLPVTGPGMVVTVGDAEPETGDDPLGGDNQLAPNDEGLVRDRDLQQLINALWASGAEAITVDGRRLSPTTPIRAAGGAILVDFRPISNPYVIEAIGEPDRLVARFANTETARLFSTFRSLRGLQFDVVSADELSLAAASAADPRYAEPVTGSAGGSSGASEPGDAEPSNSLTGSGSEGDTP